jgi:hypothetical protein
MHALLLILKQSLTRLLSFYSCSNKILNYQLFKVSQIYHNYLVV